MTGIVKGKAPSEHYTKKTEYLLKKLDETRKDCQWLLGLSAASVLGVVLKDNLASASPGLRTAALVVSAIQILVSMVGSMSLWTRQIDPADKPTVLERRLRARYLLRNVSILLLATSFILIAVIGWKMPGNAK